MANSIFGTGISGLNAAQMGLATTGHNISNATTPGFSRQRVEQTNAIPLPTGSGFLGQGVQVDTVQRMYSQFLDSQTLQAQSQASYLQTYDAQIRQIDTLLADPSSGLAPAVQDFFAAVQDVASNPASLPSRQAMYSQGASLVARFQSLNQRFTEIRDGVNSQLTSTVEEINSTGKRIAALNQQIILAKSNSAEQPPNDLLDQRDNLIAELNKLVQATVVKQSDGSYNVFIGNGQNLVLGAQSATLSASPSLDDPQRLDVGYTLGSTTALLNASLLQGGSLGALLAFRSATLDSAQNALGRVALGLSQSFNAQHALGQDLNGALGGSFFTSPALTVIPKSGNGTAMVNAALASASALTTSDYRVTYNAGSYTLVRLSDNTTTNLGALAAPVTVDGVTFSLTAGVQNNGDSFLVQPTRAGARDISLAINDAAKIAAAAPIRTAATLSNTGSGKISAGTVSSTANLPLPGTVTLTYNSALSQFAVAGAVPAAGPFAYTSGNPISFNGISVTVTGTPANGDTFTIAPNANGVADNRNALLLATLQTQNKLANGTATYQGAYGQMVSDVGNKARETQVTSRAQDKLLEETKKARESLSGVNLDEEAANLMRYQQAYQASAKVIQIAGSLFQTVLELGK